MRLQCTSKRNVLVFHDKTEQHLQDEDIASIHMEAAIVYVEKDVNR